MFGFWFAFFEGWSEWMLVSWFVFVEELRVVRGVVRVLVCLLKGGRSSRLCLASC